MSLDEATMLARADLELCLTMPAILVAIGDSAAAAQLAKAAPRILSIDDLEDWHGVHVSSRNSSVQGALLVGYARDVSDSLLHAPQFFDEAIKAFQSLCRDAIFRVLASLPGSTGGTAR